MSSLGSGDGLAREVPSPSVGRAASFGQWRLWFLDQLDPGNPAYNVQVALRLKGRLHVPALGAALAEIVRRHEILRTTFSTVAGEPRQIVSPPQPPRLRPENLLELPEGERETEARRLVAREALRPFDLARGPLLRTLLLPLGEEEHVLLMVMHHIVTDGWSTGVLFREWGALYRAFTLGLPFPLPDLPMQYADFADWQRQSLRGEVLRNQLSYWKRQLGGELPVLELPTDRPRATSQGFHGARQSFLVPRDTADALKSLSLDEGATLYMTLLAAFATVLYRRAGQEDLLIGTPMAGRTQLESEDLIGFFVNPLALRIDLSGDPTFRELLRRVREVALDAYAHQDLPFEKIVEALHAPRTLSYSPLFQAWFVLQNVADPRLELDGLTVAPLEADSGQPDRGPDGTARHDLRLGLKSVANGLAGSVEFKTDLFDPSTIASLIFDYEALLRAVVLRPDAKLSLLTRDLSVAQEQEESGRDRKLSDAARLALRSSRRRAVGTTRNPA